MRKRIGLTIVAVVSAVSLLAASSASAATEVGDNCSATSTLGSNFTAFQASKGGGNPLPISAPVGGIVTHWKVASKVGAELPEQLKVLRPAGGKNFSTVAESAPGTVVPGQNSFETRIRVQAGDVFAAANGPANPIVYCPSPDGNDKMNYNPTNVAVGSINEFTEASNIRIPLVVTIEADADNDGYGDETQDKCPRSATIQAIECPLITLGSYGVASKGSALILASASSQASVSLSGTVKLPKSGKKGKAKTVTLFAGSKPIGPGQVVPFTIGFSQSVKTALTALPAKKSLTLNVTASTTDLAGALSTSVVSLKLKGQAKAKAKPKKG